MADLKETKLDPRSGYCPATGVYRSKCRPVKLRTDPYLDVTTFLSSKHHSDTTALINASTGRRVSFPELHRSVSAVATALLSPPLSARKGQTVLLLSPNSVHFPVVSLAMMSIGAVITIANPLNTPREIAKQMTDSSPVLVFTTRDLIGKLPIDGGFPIILLEESQINSEDSRIMFAIQEIIVTEPNPYLLREIVSQDDTGHASCIKGIIENT